MSLLHQRLILVLVVNVFCCSCLNSADHAQVVEELPTIWKAIGSNSDRAIISPDGKVVAVRYTQPFPHAILFHRHSAKPFARVSTCDGELFTFTPDSKHLLTQRLHKPAGQAGCWEVATWDVAGGTVSRRFSLAAHGLNKHAYAVSNTTLIVADEYRTMTAYSLQNGISLGKFHLQGHAPCLLALSRDAKRLLTAGDKGDLQLWDAQKRVHIQELGKHSSKIQAVAISFDGSACSSVTQEKGVPGRVRHLWVFDLTKRAECVDVPLLMFDVTFLAFTPDGKSVITAGYGVRYGMNIWDWKAKKEIRGGFPKMGITALTLTKKNNAFDPKWNVGEILAGSMATDGSLLTLGNSGQLRMWWDSLVPDDPEPPKKSRPKN